MITYNYERVPTGTDGKDARDTYRTRIQFPNGWSVSFVAGADNGRADGRRILYCEPVRNASEIHAVVVGDVEATGEFKTVEVAILNPHGELIPFQSGDTVKGWVDAMGLLGILKWASEQTNG